MKTGTSSDFRDAWAIGYSGRYLVAAWFGNLDRRPMFEMTGARGPALLLRSIFTELRRRGNDRPVAPWSRSDSRKICTISGLLGGARCPVMDESFIHGSAPASACDGSHVHAVSEPAGIIQQPSPQLRLARDPRIPDDREYFALTVRPGLSSERVDWFVDGVPVGSQRDASAPVLWKLSAGTHRARAELSSASGEPARVSEEVEFIVR